MRVSWQVGRHRGWRESVDAFVDGELSGEQTRRLQAHVTSCTECSTLVDQRTEVKRLTIALPEVRAPREFRLTPGMLVEPGRARESRGTPVIARVALVTAGMAAFAFAAVLFADLSTSDHAGDTTLQATAGGDDDTGPAPASADAAGAPGSAERNSASGGQATSSTQEPPEVGGNVGAASNPSQTPQPLATDNSSYLGSPTEGPAPDDLSKNLSEQGEEAPSAVGDAFAIGESDGGSGRTLLLAEIALATLAVAAVLAWVALRRRGTQ